MSEEKEKGCFATIPIILVAAFFFIGGCVMVACLVWFEAPRKVCSTTRTESDDVKATCMAYVNQYGKDEFCGKPNDTKAEDEKAKKIKEEIEAAAAAAAAAKAALRTGLRLNKTLLPHHYDLSLWPRFYGENDTTFTGDVTIHFTCKEETDVIVLHANMLTVQNDSILLQDLKNVENKIDSTEEDVPRHFYKIYPSKNLQKNMNYTLRMNFNGTLNHPDFLGFYRSPYKENNITNYMVSTQFQITGGRRCFPLFEEPFFKATFTVVLTRKDDYIALSNTERRSSSPQGGGWVRDTFAKTVVMPPYLLAFSINKFDHLERRTNRNTVTRVYTNPSYLDYARYANNITAPSLVAFEDWTGINYPLTKLDQMLVHQFNFGAMENWGLAMYRDGALLYNPDYSTTANRIYTASTITHELTHMWFGNLVTCRWWDDTFLNEGFADFFAYYVGLETAEPTYEVDHIFIRAMQEVMQVDGSADSPPIRLPELEHHDELINAFSWQVYVKGASMMRMIRDFLGPDTFQRALRRYLQDNAYKTVVDEDLYRALQDQAVFDGLVTWNMTRTNLSNILHSWMDQQNFPLLTVIDQADGSLKVTQSRFVYDQDKNVSYPTPLGDEFLWDIPIRWTDSTMKTNFTWMLRDKEIRLHGVQRQGWKYLNPGLTGYYRVRYGDENWNAILYQLVQNHTVFPVENRAGFIDDAFEIAKAGLMEEVDALRSTEYLRYEDGYLPWKVAMEGRINFYLDMFFGKPAFDQLEQYLRKLITPMYNVTSWTTYSNSGATDKLLGSTIIQKACEMNLEPCLNQAKDLYDQFMNNPSNNPILPDLRSTVYCTGLAEGGVQEWDFLKGRLQHNYGDVYIARENETVAASLACATKVNIIRRYLDFALAYNSTTMFTAIAMKREAKDTVWNYIGEKWDDFTDGNETRISKRSTLVAVTSTWNTEGELQKLKNFIMTHNETELATIYASIMAKIEENKDWLDDNMVPIENWLKAVNTGQSYKRMPARRRRKRSVTSELVKHSDAPYNTNHRLRPLGFRRMAAMI